MRCVVARQFGGPEVLSLEDRPLPDAGEGEARIAIRAAGVNYADIMQREGIYPNGPQPPYLAGFEFSGEVVELGSGVSNLKEGDRVMGLCKTGGYAEAVTAGAHTLLAVPDSLDFIQAAAIPCQYLTAYHALITLGNLKEGQTVLIQAAAGGLGTVLVQIAKHLGATVIGTCSTQAKCDLISFLGCDHPINYVENDFRKEVDRITGGEGCELIVESVGGRVFDLSLRCLKPHGRLIVLGIASRDPRPIYGAYLLPNNLTVSGFHLNGYLGKKEAMAGAVSHLYEWVEKGVVQFDVREVFPLEEAAEAHRKISARKTSGKVVLTP